MNENTYEILKELKKKIKGVNISIMSEVWQEKQVI